MNPRHRFAAIPALGLLAALAAPALMASPAIAANGQKQVVDVVELDGAKSSEELTGKLASNEGSTIADADDFTSATSTRKVEDGASALATRPATFDLRSADLDGDGTPENYVTPVKLQNPFGTCWSFGSSGAAEASLLSELGLGVPVGTDNNNLNLSEKHLAWFSMTPEPAGSQQGEGIYNLGALESDDSSARFGGGFISTATSLYATGAGPIDESMDPVLEYHNNSATEEEQYDITKINPEAAEKFGLDIERYLVPKAGGDWSIPEEWRRVSNYELGETYYLPSPASFEPTADPDVQTYKFNQAGVDAIKDQLLAGRAVGIGFSADTSQPGQVGVPHYLNNDTMAHYTYESPNEGPDKGGAANHAVCIVGYDDTYSKDNFFADHQPEGDGAFIVKNSWGSFHGDEKNWGTFGCNPETLEDMTGGYFYLSYYDKSIQMPEAFDFITAADGASAGTSTSEPIGVKQYAFLPNDPVGTDYDAVTSFANVYPINEDCTIRDISTQTFSFGTDVRFDIYLLNDGATNPSDGELLWSRDVHYPYGGYHRVTVDQPLLLKQGDKVGVVCTAKLPSGSYEVVNNQYQSEYSAQAQTPDPSARKWAEAVVNPGESFIGEPSKRVEYSDGSYAYGDYAWADYTHVISEGKEAARLVIDQAGIDDLMKVRDDAYAALSSLSPDDPSYADATAKVDAAQDALDSAVQAIESSARRVLYAQDNFPLNITTASCNPDNPPTEKTIELYRLYNPATGEHLYTSDANERDVLSGQGWNAEGTGWTAPASSNTPVHRLLDPLTGEHLYSADANERAVLVRDGWTDEGVAFHSDGSHATPVYRLHNPSLPGVASHHFTTDAHERDVLVRNGWRNEGVAWYGA